MSKDILTTAQAATLLGVSIRTAQLLIEGGTIPSWKTPGGHRRVYRADVLAVIAGSHGASDVTSAIVTVVASAARLPQYARTLATIAECSVDGYHDPHTASFAIGSRVPAAIVVDLHDEENAHRAFLSSLLANPLLGRTRLFTVGGASDSMPTGAVSPRVTHVRSAEHLPNVLGAFLLEAAEPIAPEGVSFPLAANESFRLAALERSGLVDTPAEDAFDRLTWLASHTLAAPVALLTVLTSTRQWFKSRQGLEFPDTPRSWSFCNHTILQKDVFVVENLREAPEFADNPAVAGPPAFRFYAGAPVLDPDGFALGALCVLDYEPRTLSEVHRRVLLALAAMASDRIRLRAVERQLHEAREVQRPRAKAR